MRALPDALNPEDAFGAQYVVDAAGEYVRTETRLLLTSTDLSLDDVVAGVNALGGAAIPAHVDRPMNGLLAQLGFAPPGLNVAAWRFLAVPIARHCWARILGWGVAADHRQRRPPLSEMRPTLCFEPPGQGYDRAARSRLKQGRISSPMMRI